VKKDPFDKLFMLVSGAQLARGFGVSRFAVSQMKKKKRFPFTELTGKTKYAEIAVQLANKKISEMNIICDSSVKKIQHHELLRGTQEAYFKKRIVIK